MQGWELCCPISHNFAQFLHNFFLIFGDLHNFAQFFTIFAQFFAFDDVRVAKSAMSQKKCSEVFPTSVSQVRCCFQHQHFCACKPFASNAFICLYTSVLLSFFVNTHQNRRMRPKLCIILCLLFSYPTGLRIFCTIYFALCTIFFRFCTNLRNFLRNFCTTFFHPNRAQFPASLDKACAVTCVQVEISLPMGIARKVSDKAIMIQS